MSPTGSRLRFFVLACCVCLAATLAAGLAMGAAPTASEDAPARLDDAPLRVVDLGNTSNYLQPERGAETRDGTTYQDVEVGMAVAAGTDAIEGHHQRLAFEQRFRDAPNESARLELFRDAVDRLDARAERLRTRHSEARAGFRDGSLSTDAYFRTLARLDASTDQVQAFRDRLEGRVGRFGIAAQPSLETIQTLEADLETMGGPVADQVRARYAGNATAGTAVMTVTDDGGFVHAMVVGDRFYRVAQESPDWNRDGTDRFTENGGSGGLSQAFDRAGELYPWTFTHQFGSPPPRGVFPGTALYKLGVVHQHGELTIYLDGSTEEVFREVQEKRLSEIPFQWHRTATTDDLTVRVNGTHGTGPLEVHLTRPDSTVGVDAEVRIDDTYVGDTDGEGRLWTVQPPGGFTVNATTDDGESVDLTLPEEPS